VYATFEKTHLQIRSADFLPDTSVADEVNCSFANAASQCLQARLVVQLIQKSSEESNVFASVDKMSPRSLVIWFPDLDRHGLCEDLLAELVSCTHSRAGIIRFIIVHDMCSLQPNVSLVGRSAKTRRLTRATMR